MVTNASVWDTTNSLLPDHMKQQRIDSGDTQYLSDVKKCDSFVHLHLGIDATGLPPNSELGIHHLVVDDWSKGVDGNRNVFNISIPTTLDPSQVRERAFPKSDNTLFYL